MGWEHGGGEAAAGGGGGATLHLKKKVKLVLYPGEEVRGGTTYGHIYIVGGKNEAYEIAAGPPPGQGSSGPGGHSAGATPAGKYVLSAKEHHTTINWPMSSIPWGAKLEKRADGDVYYTIGGGAPRKITGAGGVMTQAGGLFYDRTYDGYTAEQKKKIDKAKARQQFIDSCYAELYDAAGTLLPVWQKNDFGEWAWNLMKGTSRSPYYIHTTPEEELGRSKALAQSHGCVHVWPKDRDEMMARGYLEKGTELEVKSYTDRP